MKSDYSLLKNLPYHRHPSMIIDHFSNNIYKVGSEIYKNLYELLLNFDLYLQTQQKLEEKYDSINKLMNDETRNSIKKQHEKNLSTLKQFLENNEKIIDLFYDEISTVDKDDLINLIEELSTDDKPTNQKIRIINILKKGI